MDIIVRIHAVAVRWAGAKGGVQGAAVVAMSLGDARLRAVIAICGATAAPVGKALVPKPSQGAAAAPATSNRA